MAEVVKKDNVPEEKDTNTIGDYLWAVHPEQYVALTNMFSSKKVKIVTE